MPATIVIVADDLTGAADCGIACTLAGLPTVVVAFGDLRRAEELEADVISFDTDTRRVPPEVADTETAHAVTTLCQAGTARVIYKKIDSTLRGNFAVEIAAARRASAEVFGGRLPMAIVAPAFPGTGRTTRDGRMLLAGEPLETTAVWRNEKIPGIADVPALLASAGGLKAGVVSLEAVRGGVEGLETALIEQSMAGMEAVACDAETEEDLRALAFASARLPLPAIFAGSAGLMRHLPDAFELSKTGAAPAPATFTPGPLLFVVGSMSEVSREGLRTLAAEPGVRVLTLSPAILRGGERSPAWIEAAGIIHAATLAGEDVALSLGLEDGVDLGESALLSGALARFVLPLAPRFVGLFLTGGETARALLNAAGAAGIRLIGEVEPGVPMGTAEGWHNLPIITKAGAFGNAGTLVRARAALRGQGEDGGLKTMTFR